VSFLPPQKGKILKKAEKAFDFSQKACKLCFGIGLLIFRNPSSSSFDIVIFQQIRMETDQVKMRFAMKLMDYSGRMTVFTALAGCFFVFHCRLLVGPPCVCLEALGFFPVASKSAGFCLMEAKVQNSIHLFLDILLFSPCEDKMQEKKE
jgi:hypothetical protein